MSSPLRRTPLAGATVCLLALLLIVLGPVPRASALPGDLTVTVEAQNEGTGASPTIFTFTVAVEGPFTGTVAYTIDDGTARAGEDYVDPGDGTLLFNPLTPSRTVDVAVNADAAPEPTETFSLTIHPLVGTCSPCTAVATIINEDGAAPVASVATAPVAETTGAPTTATFT
ncbi:MAG TPA: Calx-beta domain-containing protein, partial [Acidimicrobiales bacterium]|nr:Calx-beta domain-containing protein [Acidimicrobiales bacterium]